MLFARPPKLLTTPAASGNLLSEHVPFHVHKFKTTTSCGLFSMTTFLSFRGRGDRCLSFVWAPCPLPFSLGQAFHKRQRHLGKVCFLGCFWAHLRGQAIAMCCLLTFLCRSKQIIRFSSLPEGVSKAKVYTDAYTHTYRKKNYIHMNLCA